MDGFATGAGLAGFNLSVGDFGPPAVSWDVDGFRGPEGGFVGSPMDLAGPGTFLAVPDGL